MTDGLALSGHGAAVIEDGCIVIRVSIDALPVIAEGGWASGSIDARWRFSDPLAFARDLVRELNRESEDGTTPVHRAFDQAISAAADNGADGVDLHPEQAQ